MRKVNMIFFFHWNLQKQQIIQASPKKTETQILVNGNLVDEKDDVSRIAAKPVQEKKLVEKPTEIPIAAKPETVKQEKKPETKVSKVSEVKGAAARDADSFVVTPDYIQQSKLPSPMQLESMTSKQAKMKTKTIFTISAIKNALKQENLNPEIEEKLLNLQRYQEKQMKSEHATPSLVHNHHEYTSSPAKQTPRKRPVSRTHEDDDWHLDTPKRRPPKSNSLSEKKQSSAAAAAIETNVNKIIQSVEKEAAAEAKEAKDTKPSPKSATPSPTKPNNRRIAAIKRESEKKKQQQQLQVSLCGRFDQIFYWI